LGQPKQLLRFRGKSLVHHIVAAARQAGCSPVIVVIGSDSEKVTGELRLTSALIVENENWQRGIGSSIRAGVQGLIDYAPGIDAVVLLVCDQPFVNANTIRNLIKLREETKKALSRHATRTRWVFPPFLIVPFLTNCSPSATKLARSRLFCEIASASLNLRFPKVRSTAILGKIGKS
jgi:CTP:molybdopterin cytidylyltransferase MocA